MRRAGHVDFRTEIVSTEGTGKRRTHEKNRRDHRLTVRAPLAPKKRWLRLRTAWLQRKRNSIPRGAGPETSVGSTKGVLPWIRTCSIASTPRRSIVRDGTGEAQAAQRPCCQPARDPQRFEQLRAETIAEATGTHATVQPILEQYRNAMRMVAATPDRWASRLPPAILTAASAH